MDFTKFVSLMETRALFFCRADLLGDPFEGSISPVTPPAASPDLKVGAVSLKQVDFRQVIRMKSVNCWHSGNFESAAMWRLYSREHEGIAIKTTFKRFKESFCGEREVVASMVKYIDYATTPVPFGNTMFPLIHKRNSFQHEQEVLAISILDTNNFESDESVGQYIDINIGRLISEIIVAPFAPDWFFDLVQSLASHFELENKVFASSLSEKPTFKAQFLIQSSEEENAQK